MSSITEKFGIEQIDIQVHKGKSSMITSVIAQRVNAV